MARLIDADALIEFIDMGHFRNPLEACFSECDVVDMLESRETIDAEPVIHGHWVACTLLIEMGALNGLKCSICGHEKAGRNVKYNYCPNCGAKMDEVSE